MQIFDETYAFVDNGGVNITLSLDTLSQELISLQSNLTMTVKQLNTGCDKIKTTYPLFADKFDCQRIQAGLNIATLNADIDSARNSLQQMNASIGGALDSARVAISQVELEVFETVGSARQYLDNISNALFTPGACPGCLWCGGVVLCWMGCYWRSVLFGRHRFV